MKPAYKLLLDEGLPLGAAKILRFHGVDAVHAEELQLASAADPVILERAKLEGRPVSPACCRSAVNSKPGDHIWVVDLGREPVRRATEGGGGADSATTTPAFTTVRDRLAQELAEWRKKYT